MRLMDPLTLWWKISPTASTTVWGICIHIHAVFAEIWQLYLCLMGADRETEWTIGWTMISLNLLIIMIMITMIIMILIRVELVNHPYCNSGADQSLDRQTKICRPALWNEPIFIGRVMMRVMTMMTMMRRRMWMTDKLRSSNQRCGMSPFLSVGWYWSRWSL